MIKNIIFDLGQVLINYDFGLFFRACGLNPKEHRFRDDLPLISKFDAGLINRETFYNEMRKIYGFNLSQTEFEKAWCTPFWENAEMLEFAHELSPDYRLFILSNTDEIHFPFLWKTFPNLHIFKTNLMLSYILGCVKPDVKIFRLALNQFSLKPDECLFIDDKKANIESAKRYGLSAILHKENNKTITSLYNILTRLS
jgi:putative hydrolase of the HAD superfamily